MFAKSKKIPFGLDISDVSLKFIQFSRRGGIAAYSDMALPKDVVVSDAIRDRKGLIKAIRAAIAKPQFGEVALPEVVASVPETKSFVRVIQMPKMTEEEAREAVPWEAEAYIPMPVGAVYLDWVILDADKRGAKEVLNNADKMTVMITASPKDYIDDYVLVLKEAGLRPLALEVESAATARSLVGGAHLRESVMIADVDTVRTSFIIYNKGVLEFTSSLPIAGNSLSDGIAKALTIDMAAAEKLKRETGLSGEGERGGEARAAMLPILRHLVEEIKNTIHFHEEHDPGSKITRLLLAGGSSKLRHLPSWLQEKLKELGIQVELGNPWSKVLKAGETPPLSREDSLSYATAIGLALRELP